MNFKYESFEVMPRNWLMTTHLCMVEGMSEVVWMMAFDV